MQSFCCAHPGLAGTVAIVHSVTMGNDDQPAKALPDFLTVEEAAQVLRIGRTAAYEQTRRYEETDGEAGIPVIRVGRLMRVPRVALEGWLGGPLTTSESRRPEESPASPPRKSRRRREPKYPQQGLPLDD